MMNKKAIIRILRIVMPLVAVLCLVVFSPWQGIIAWLAPLPDSVQEQLDDAINRDLDGIIVYVDQQGQEPQLFAAGWKNRSTNQRADPHALFKIASISKLYLAAATAKLVSDGRLSLDETLADYLPELVGKIENSDEITLKMMLQHRSGIPNSTDQNGFEWFNPPASDSAILDLIINKPASFEPDAQYQYSNSNFFLIGRILDQTLGYSHRLYINQEILAPLGLTHTFGLLSEVDIDELVSGYHHPYNADLREIEFISPSGSMIATAQDVGLFLRALIDGSLLNAEEQSVYSSIYEYEHKGWIVGYQSIARYHPDMDAVVIQFVNTTGENSELTTAVVYNRIVKILKAH